MIEDTVDAQLIGYFAKRVVRRPDRLQARGVLEICSVATCISEGPEDWIEEWRHNELGFYDTVELAWSVVPQAQRTEFEIFAYKLFPIEFKQGRGQPLLIPPLEVAPLVGPWERLGYDIVSRSVSIYFEHSPLSCNSMAEKHDVNPYCLVDDLQTALKLAGTFEQCGCEPGPYYVIEVWRPGGRLRP